MFEKNTEKTMASGGGMSCVKYLLFFFNLLFAVTGAFIVNEGAKRLSLASVGSAMKKNDTSGPITIIVIGVIVVYVAFFGCYGIIKEKLRMIVTFSVLVLVMYVVELLGVGIGSYMRIQNVREMIKDMNRTMMDFPIRPEATLLFDNWQIFRQCCGMYGPSDWTDNSMPIPYSCCAGQEIWPGGVVMPCSLMSPNLNKEGCLIKEIADFNESALDFGKFVISIAGIQLLCVIFACSLSCCLARAIRKK